MIPALGYETLYSKSVYRTATVGMYEGKTQKTSEIF